MLYRVCKIEKLDGLGFARSGMLESCLNQTTDATHMPSRGLDEGIDCVSGGETGGPLKNGLRDKLLVDLVAELGKCTEFASVGRIYRVELQRFSEAACELRISLEKPLRVLVASHDDRNDAHIEEPLEFVSDIDLVLTVPGEVLNFIDDEEFDALLRHELLNAKLDLIGVAAIGIRVS